MKRPVVGIIGSMHLAENRFPAQRVGERNLRAVRDVVGALPLMFAGSPDITDVDALLDVAARVATRARIFASPGPQFGPGGDTWLRFNLATPRPLLLEALSRLDEAFADLRR